MTGTQTWRALCCAGPQQVWEGERTPPLPIHGTCGAVGTGLVSSGHWDAPGMGQRGLWAGWCRMDATPWSRIRTRVLP